MTLQVTELDTNNNSYNFTKICILYKYWNELVYVRGDLDYIQKNETDTLLYTIRYLKHTGWVSLFDAENGSQNGA